jgi:hypothetical protein
MLALRTPTLAAVSRAESCPLVGRPAEVVTNTDPDPKRCSGGAEHGGCARGVVTEIRPGEEVFAQHARRLVFEVEHVVDAPKKLQLIDDLPACVLG